MSAVQTYDGIEGVCLYPLTMVTAGITHPEQGCMKLKYLLVFFHNLFFFVVNVEYVMSSNFVLKTELKEVLNLKFSGSSIQVFHTLVREEEDPTSAGEPEGSWRGTEAGRLCPGCMLNGSRSKI